MYIYKTTNLKNGKIYIGLSEKSPDDSKEYLGSGDYFKRALSKYGRSSFNKEILEESIETRKDLALSEIKWITYYNSTDRKIGYNISPGGDLNPEFMKKEIYQYSRSGDLVKIHLTIDDAKKTVGSKNSDLYKKAIRESRPILGFWWSLSELTKEFVLELDKKYTTNKKKIFSDAANKRYEDPEYSEARKSHMREIQKMVKPQGISDESRKKISNSIMGRNWYTNIISAEKKQVRESPGLNWVKGRKQIK